MTDSTAKRRGRPPRTAPLQPEMAGFEQEVNYASDTPGIERPPMRPAMREDDPRVAAARRAAEIRNQFDNVDEGSDEFRTPPPPDGWTYEWKRRTLLGQEDPAYQVELARMGWEAVATKRHPEMMPLQGNHPIIERKGMILMQRPSVISDEARSNELRKARNQVRVKEQQLNAAPDGTLTRDHPSARAQIKKGYSPLEVPGD